MPTSRTELIQRIEPVFIDHGFEGATLTQLARATGLGKASLYHHFPGGKAEMAQALIRRAVEQLHGNAFRRLSEGGPATDRLHNFLDGFADYVDQGDGHCLVAVLTQGSLRERLTEAIGGQFDAWTNDLANVYESLAIKPKVARRYATETLTQLYGALVMCRLMGDNRPFKQTLKRLHKSIDRLVDGF